MTRLVLWVGLALAAATPRATAPLALMVGAVFGIALGNPQPELSQKLTQRFLMLSVVGLGAGIDLLMVARVGVQGFAYTVAGIGLALLAGWGLGRILKVPREISTLITVGTAICGGSAIAAVAPVIHAKPHQTTVALATVFVLNGVALLVFPWIGHATHLSQRQFGLWCALAIHDTSSVVGATLQYGKEALAIGTTTKLARALWIAPLTLLLATLDSRRSNRAGSRIRIRVPWFIGGFVLASALVTWFPAIQPLGLEVQSLACRGLVVTLYLIGSNLSRESIKAVGIYPFLQGLALWLVVACASLGAIWGGGI